MFARCTCEKNIDREHWLFLEPENEINCMDFSQDGDQFATAGSDHCIRIYDTETLKVCSSSLPVEQEIFSLYTVSQKKGPPVNSL